MLLHSFSCDSAKITVFVFKSFFKDNICYLVVICSIDTKSKIAASIIMMTQQKTTQEKSRRRCFIFFLLKLGRRWWYWWLAKKKIMKFKVGVFTNIQICKLFHNKRPMSLLYAQTSSIIMPEKCSSGQVPLGIAMTKFIRGYEQWPRLLDTNYCIFTILNVLNNILNGRWS